MRQRLGLTLVEVAVGTALICVIVATAATLTSQVQSVMSQPREPDGDIIEAVMEKLTFETSAANVDLYEAGEGIRLGAHRVERMDSDLVVRDETGRVTWVLKRGIQDARFTQQGRLICLYLVTSGGKWTRWFLCGE